MAYHKQLGPNCAIRVAKVAPNSGRMGLCAEAEKSVNPKMSVAPIFGWMEGVLYRLAQSKIIEVSMLNLERPPKIIWRNREHWRIC